MVSTEKSKGMGRGQAAFARAGTRTAAPVMAVLIALYLLAAALLPALEVPPLRGRVNDYANMISPAAVAQIESLSLGLERSDSTQVVVLTVASLEDEDLEGYSIRVAETWKIGQQEFDNGVLLLVAQAERRVRIEVGYGLEGRLTDLQAGRIIEYEIVPYFKAGQFDEGLIRGTEAIVATVRGEYQASEQTAPRPASRSRAGFVPFFILLVVLSIIGSRRRIISAAAGAILFPLVAWFALPLSLMVALLFIPLGFVGGLILPGIFLFSGSRTGRGGRFYGGGGFGGGGVFSGGGGGFGGGGASGSW